jgi:hypothetical protein
VPVGDKLVDHNASFKLYLVTRNASPQLTPDVLPLLTVTNFSITRSGLESKRLLLLLLLLTANVLQSLLPCLACMPSRPKSINFSAVVSSSARLCASCSAHLTSCA